MFLSCWKWNKGMLKKNGNKLKYLQRKLIRVMNKNYQNALRDTYFIILYNLFINIGVIDINIYNNSDGNC